MPSKVLWSFVVLFIDCLVNRVGAISTAEHEVSVLVLWLAISFSVYQHDSRISWDL